ncbi:hypothetical protein X975_11647, partial [Stegodyphus mimosarum]
MLRDFYGQITLQIKMGKPNTKVLRMVRILFRTTFSPFLLITTIKYHINTFEETNQKAVKLLKECLYINDLIGGSEDKKKR